LVDGNAADKYQANHQAYYMKNIVLLLNRFGSVKHLRFRNGNPLPMMAETATSFILSHLLYIELGTFTQECRHLRLPAATYTHF
jgi:hypothetical protein